MSEPVNKPVSKPDEQVRKRRKLSTVSKVSTVSNVKPMSKSLSIKELLLRMNLKAKERSNTAAETCEHPHHEKKLTDNFNCPSLSGQARLEEQVGSPGSTGLRSNILNIINNERGTIGASESVLEANPEIKGAPLEPANISFSIIQTKQPVEVLKRGQLGARTA